MTVLNQYFGIVELHYQNNPKKSNLESLKSETQNSVGEASMAQKRGSFD